MYSLKKPMVHSWEITNLVILPIHVNEDDDVRHLALQDSNDLLRASMPETEIAVSKSPCSKT